MVVRVRIPLGAQNEKDMKNTSGYKGMLRNRLPVLVNYALKWQKAKERWIDHVYKNFINIYTDKEERRKVTYLICKERDFVKTIDWDNLIATQYDPKDIDKDNDPLYWKRESTWHTIYVLIGWFMNNYESIKDTYESSRSAGMDEFNIKITLINSHLRLFLPSKDANEEKKQEMYKFVDNLVDFLIDCFEGRIH